LNATNLANYKTESIENTLLFGPLYHLTEETEIKKYIKEIHRVLKRGGLVFASFIPQVCGIKSILERSIASPEQVDAHSFLKVVEEGVFNNLTNTGFQEVKYLNPDWIHNLFSQQGFINLEMRSIRGIGYGMEEDVLKLEKERPAYFCKVMEILHQTADLKAIIETSGHAIIVAKKEE